MNPWEKYQTSAVATAPASSGPWDKFQSQAQPAQPQSQDIGQLQEFGSSGGLSELFGDGEGFLDGQLGGDSDVGAGQLVRDAASQFFTLDPKARVDGIEKRFPELQIERIQDGKNAIVTNPQNGKRVVVNKKGLSTQDLAGIVGTALPAAKLAKGVGLATSIGGKALAAGTAAAATDVAIQGVEKLQGSDQDFNLARTAFSAATGGALQGVGSKIAQSVDKRAARDLITKAAPSVDELKATATGLYQKVDDLGVTLKPESFDGLVNKLSKSFSNGGFIPENQSQTANVLNAFIKRKGQSMSFSDIEQLRKTLGGAAQTLDRSDSAAASKLIGVLDDALEALPQSALQSSKGVSASQASQALKQARATVSQSKSAEKLSRAIERGKLAASGPENGIRNEMRTIAKRIAGGKEKGFSADQVKAITSAANGDGANILKLIGKGAFDPSNNNFLGGSIGTLATGAATGGNPLAIVAQQAISGTSKKLAERATVNNAKFVEAAARAGKNSIQLARAYVKNVPKKDRSIEQFAEIIRAQGVNADELIKKATAFGGDNKQLIMDAARLVAAEQAAS
jgi:hypothetical protein